MRVTIEIEDEDVVALGRRVYAAMSTDGTARARLDPQQPSPAVLLSVPDAAARLSISKSSMNNLIYRGIVPSVQIGRSRRVRVSVLDNVAATGASLNDS